MCYFLRSSDSLFEPNDFDVEGRRQRELLAQTPRRLLSILAHFCEGEGVSLRRAAEEGEDVRGSRWQQAGIRRAARGRLEQVHTAVVQEVGCALRSGLHHLVLADHLDRLVVDAQPAVEADLEDVRGVVAARGTAAVVVDHCK